MRFQAFFDALDRTTEAPAGYPGGEAVAFHVHPTGFYVEEHAGAPRFRVILGREETASDSLQPVAQAVHAYGLASGELHFLDCPECGGPVTVTRSRGVRESIDGDGNFLSEGGDGDRYHFAIACDSGCTLDDNRHAEELAELYAAAEERFQVAEERARFHGCTLADIHGPLDCPDCEGLWGHDRFGCGGCLRAEWPQDDDAVRDAFSKGSAAERYRWRAMPPAEAVAEMHRYALSPCPCSPGGKPSIVARASQGARVECLACRRAGPTEPRIADAILSWNRALK